MYKLHPNFLTAPESKLSTKNKKITKGIMARRATPKTEYGSRTSWTKFPCARNLVDNMATANVITHKAAILSLNKSILLKAT